MAAAAPKLQHTQSVHGIYRFSVLECSPRAVVRVSCAGLKLREWDTGHTQKKTCSTRHKNCIGVTATGLLIGHKPQAHKATQHRSKFCMQLEMQPQTLNCRSLPHSFASQSEAPLTSHSPTIHTTFRFKEPSTHKIAAAAAAAQWSSDPLLWACICVHAGKAKPCRRRKQNTACCCFVGMLALRPEIRT